MSISKSFLLLFALVVGGCSQEDSTPTHPIVAGTSNKFFTARSERENSAHGGNNGTAGPRPRWQATWLPPNRPKQRRRDRHYVLRELLKQRAKSLWWMLGTTGKRHHQLFV